MGVRYASGESAATLSLTLAPTLALTLALTLTLTLTAQLCQGGKTAHPRFRKLGDVTPALRDLAQVDHLLADAVVVPAVSKSQQWRPHSI